MKKLIMSICVLNVFLSIEDADCSNWRTKARNAVNQTHGNGAFVTSGSLGIATTPVVITPAPAPRIDEAARLETETEAARKAEEEKPAAPAAEPAATAEVHAATAEVHAAPAGDAPPAGDVPPAAEPEAEAKEHAAPAGDPEAPVEEPATPAAEPEKSVNTAAFSTFEQIFHHDLTSDQLRIVLERFEMAPLAEIREYHDKDFQNHDFKNASFGDNKRLGQWADLEAFLRVVNGMKISKDMLHEDTGTFLGHKGKRLRTIIALYYHALLLGSTCANLSAVEDNFQEFLKTIFTVFSSSRG